MMARGRLLLVPEIAERIRRSEGATRWLIHTGALQPTAVVGGRRVMAEEDLEEWIEAQFAEASV
jgi:hypothetical protein